MIPETYTPAMRRTLIRILGPVPGRPGWERRTMAGAVRYRHETGLELVHAGDGRWALDLDGERPYDPVRGVAAAFDLADDVLEQMREAAP